MDNKKDLVVSLFTDYCGGNKDAFAQLYTETLDYTYRIVRLLSPPSRTPRIWCRMCISKYSKKRIR